MSVWEALSGAMTEKVLMQQNAATVRLVIKTAASTVPITFIIINYVPLISLMVRCG